MTPEWPMALNNARWETFAQACARGSSPKAAAEAAEFVKPGWRAGKLLEQSRIRKRIIAILERRGGGGSDHVGGLIDKLIALADKAMEKPDEARRLDVARDCLADAGRLKQLMPPEPVPRPPPQPPMSLAEWRQEFDPTLPGSKAWVEAQANAAGGAAVQSSW